MELEDIMLTFVNNDSFNQFKDMMRSDENINNLNNETSKTIHGFFKNV